MRALDPERVERVCAVGGKQIVAVPREDVRERLRPGPEGGVLDCDLRRHPPRIEVEPESTSRSSSSRSTPPAAEAATARRTTTPRSAAATT